MFTNNYFSYLMRIWQDEDPHQEGGRASLEDPTSKHITYIKSIEALVEFIRNQSILGANDITTLEKDKFCDGRKFF